jgi:N-acetylmuramidase
MNIRKFIPAPSILVLYVVLAGFMVILGVLIYRVLNVPDSVGMRGITIPEKLALIVILAWMALLIAYYSWQIYFYNYNYGKSSEFWKKFIEKAEAADKAEGEEYKSEAQLHEELGAPTRNPFYDQTFGLPPGTVRGTLALTVMVGGLCLLILAVGGSDLFNKEAFQRQLNFFEQAFLMVIAFYFGTKGFEILQQEQTKRTLAGAAGQPAAARQPAAAGAQEEEMEEPEVKTVAVATATAAPASNGAPVKAAVKAELKPEVKAEVRVKPEVVVNKEVIVKNIVQHYPHVSDLEENLFLQPDQINKFAEKYGLEVPAVRAVIEIEASGKGFLKDGRPKILFEGHVFWRQLKAYKINPAKLAARHPSIVYQNWTRQHYLTGTLEYKRLNEARAIHESAALESASWGLFQIMGYHAYKMGFKTVQEFVRKQGKSEEEHLNAFGLYIGEISPACLKALKSHDWAGFARHYNGIQYAKNQYHTKLEKAYNKYKGQPELA